MNGIQAVGMGDRIQEDRLMINQNTPDRVVWRADLQTSLSVTSNTVRRWILSGKLPQPDVDISRKTKGWRLSTLHDAGIRIL